MDVLCVGMYRSCSTWQYDVVAHLLERHRGVCRLGVMRGEEYADSLKQAGREPGWRVLKAHQGVPAHAQALAGGRARAVYSYRDLRDVAYSLVHKFESSFEEVIERRRMLQLCLDNDAFWRSQPGVLCQRYEEIIDDPAGSVAELADHLQLTLAPGEAEEVAREYSLEANQWRVVEFAGRLRAQGVNLEDPGNALLWDEQTLLHWNHIRSGQVGGWRDQVTPWQLAVLARVCTDWLLQRGYEHERDWWQPALRELVEGRTSALMAGLQEVFASQDRARLELEEARAERASACAEREAARRELAVVQAENARLQDVCAVLTVERDRAIDEHVHLHDQLAQAGARLYEMRVQLNKFESLGPAAIGLARRFHAWCVRHPRLIGLGRRLVGYRAA